MTFKTSLRRFFSWDSRNQDSAATNGEDTRAQNTRNAQFNGRSSGTDTGYSQRFTR